MNIKNEKLSRGKQKKSMLSDLLDKWELNYNSFADYLGIHRTHLWKYRQGKREFRLNMEQIHKIEKLLEKVGMKFEDLPPDWFLDEEVKPNADGPPTISEGLE